MNSLLAERAERTHSAGQASLSWRRILPPPPPNTQQQQQLAVAVADLRLQRADKVPPACPLCLYRLLQGSEEKKPALQAAAFT